MGDTYSVVNIGTNNEFSVFWLDAKNNLKIDLNLNSIDRNSKAQVIEILNKLTIGQKENTYVITSRFCAELSRDKDMILELYKNDKDFNSFNSSMDYLRERLIERNIKEKLEASMQDDTYVKSVNQKFLIYNINSTEVHTVFALNENQEVILLNLPSDYSGLSVIDTKSVLSRLTSEQKESAVLLDLETSYKLLKPVIITKEDIRQQSLSFSVLQNNQA